MEEPTSPGEPRLVNRITLAFVDPGFERDFLDEYHKNALRVYWAYIPWVMLLSFVAAVLAAVTFPPPFSTFLRNLPLEFAAGGLLIFLIFRFLPTSEHFFQLIFVLIGVWCGWFFVLMPIVLEGLVDQALVFFFLLMTPVSVCLAFPLRFPYSMALVSLIGFGFGFG
ncbi:hypothetical protein ACFL0Q_06175, partial [Thermodesulfobacteriota bacterium]